MKRLRTVLLFLLLLASIAAAQNISPLPYGINVHLAVDDVLATVKQAGISWIRIDVKWSQIERTRGQINFIETDRVIDYALGNGLSVYASISETPDWANNGQGGNYPAVNPQDWFNFVARVVNRYQTRVKYWGIWNEPNMKEFFAPGKDEFVQQVFLPAAQAIRETDPAAFIVGPELAHLTSTGSEWYFWMTYILEQCSSYLDVISHHIYENRGVYYLFELLESGDGLVPSVKSIIQDSGQDNKPFWLSETGWNTSEFAESVQADLYLEMLQTRRQKDYPQKIFFYEIIDDPRPDIPLFGILHSDLTPKPAYSVYRDFIAGLYPDDEDPPPEEDNRQCFAEMLASAQNRFLPQRLLARLRSWRRTLQGSWPGRLLVALYHTVNHRLMARALADTRLFRFGSRLLAAVADWLERTNQRAMASAWSGSTDRFFKQLIFRNRRAGD